MLFSSFEFIIFFAIYLVLRALLPNAYQVLLMVVGSTVFYAYWNPYLVWVPLVLVLLTYFCSFFIIEKESFFTKGVRLGISIAFLLVPLVYFKYSVFFAHGILEPLTGLHIPVRVHALPLGISFITFTMIAFLVDVYRGSYPLVRNIGVLSGYTMFFPQLIAGPILRPNELIPQLSDLKKSTSENVLIGCGYFAVGLVKKCLFADTFGLLADQFFNSAISASGWDALLGCMSFAIQIYCDFSGYTDMAIGTALILGITIPDNFDRPYLATSVADFWRKWHITLSSWIRDYVYIPLGGSRVGSVRHFLNLFFAMSLCGLWHGASWNFVLWGSFHGVGIILVHCFRMLRLSNYIPRIVSIVFTFIFVALGWVLFRAEDLSSAVSVYKTLLWGDYSGLQTFVTENSLYLATIIVFFVFHKFDSRAQIKNGILSLNKSVCYAVVATSVILALALNFGSSDNFIYFDF